MNYDTHCPEIAERRGKLSQAKHFNFRSEWCLERIRQQNTMPAGIRLDAGDCCNCETGLDLVMGIEFKGGE